jgi:hypothetical protein
LAKQCPPQILVDFGELPVFTAATFPMVFLGEKDGKERCTFVQVPSLDLPYPDVSAVVARGGVKLHVEQLNSDIWNFADGNEASLLNAIERAPNRIEGSKIMAGIKTGFNNAFWLDDETRSRLIAKSKAAKDFIKPLLVGDDIRNYHTKPVSRWIIYTPIGTRPDKLGPILEYLSKWKARLEHRALDQAWFELQQAQQKYCIAFESPKIVYPDIAMEPRFTYDAEGRYLDMTAFAIAADDKALLAVLNSSVAWFYLKKTAAVLGDAEKGGRLRLKRQYIEKLPIPDISEAQATILVLLSDILLWLNRYFADNTEEQNSRDPLMLVYWKQVLNGLVFELYFPEETHKAGLALFDLAKQAFLPHEIKTSEREHIRHLRAKYEKLFDIDHPLRIV